MFKGLRREMIDPTGGPQPDKGAIVVQIGDHILIESEKVGSPPRSGVVTSMHEHLLGIRWDDGSESSFMPSAGSLRVLGRAEDARADRKG